MKKFIASAVFIALFVSYAGYLHSTSTASAASSSSQAASAATTQTVATASTNSSSGSNSSGSSGTRTTAQSAPADVPNSKYKDGTYTGSSENAFYGNVQVKVTITGGKIADVAFLSYPNDRGTSRMINNDAMPQLKQEAVAAQSAQVDGVSGATDTSDAFKLSLANALAQAQA